jgi:hypothetical protein
MKNCWPLVFALVAACSSNTTPQMMMMKPAEGPGPDLAQPLSSADMAMMSTPDMAMAAGDMAMCKAPAGSTCPTTSGNCQGIGTPCTKGGGQCAASGTNCDLDLDPSGSGTCVTYGKCAPGMHQCGPGASCCKSSTTFFIPVCIVNPCLPDDCPAE